MVILGINTNYSAPCKGFVSRIKGHMPEPRLVIATNNAGKVVEFRDLLDGCGWEVVAPADASVSIDVEETGATYAENARIKARAFCEASGLPAIADDSGLEVDALGGDPGPLHHLHGWDGENDTERIQILLDALKDVPEGERSGRFYSVIVLALPDGGVIEEQGIVEGTIAFAPAGTSGWGYDPLFLLPDRGVTMAQLSEREKNRVSHRAIAFGRMRQRLQAMANAQGGLS
jgi:XTP/dITP diphosphohydrolase